VLNSIVHSLKFLFYPDKKFYTFLKNILGFNPRRIKLYELAFIHKSVSYTFPDGSVVNNERLEYLGDAILDAIIADFLFTAFPNKKEGFLTKLRSKVVNREQLDALALKIGINKYIVSHTSNSTPVKHLYGDALEALIGAVYLDKGYRETKKFFINRILKKHIDLNKLVTKDTDYKSRLIEWGQKNKKEICFESHEEFKNIDKSPTFVSYVKILNKQLGKGTGTGKKEAEQEAAKQALKNIY